MGWRREWERKMSGEGRLGGIETRGIFGGERGKERRKEEKGRMGGWVDGWRDAQDAVREG